MSNLVGPPCICKSQRRRSGGSLHEWMNVRQKRTADWQLSIYTSRISCLFSIQPREIVLRFSDCTEICILHNYCTWQFLPYYFALINKNLFPKPFFLYVCLTQWLWLSGALKKRSTVAGSKFIAIGAWNKVLRQEEKEPYWKWHVMRKGDIWIWQWQTWQSKKCINLVKMWRQTHI